MKRFVVFAICGAMVLSFTACGNSKEKPGEESAHKTVAEDSVEQSNPRKECKTLGEAEEIVQFKATVPTNIPAGYVEDSIYTIENNIIEVIYLNGENKIVFRQSKGKNDISGDYNKYNEETKVNINGLEVNTKGNNGKVNVATWTNGDFTFAINVNSSEEGIEENVITDMINSIK